MTVRTERGRLRWLAVSVLVAAGCVDVPERGDPAPQTDTRPPGADAMPDRGPPPDGAPADALADAAPDAGADARLDMAGDAAADMAADVGVDAEVDAGADVGPDMGPPGPFDGCLAPLDGVYGPDLPCLRVSVVGGATQRTVMAASITVAEGTADERVVVVGGLDGAAEAPEGSTRMRVYDPAQGGWEADGPSLTTGRWGLELAGLGDGSVVAVAGSTEARADGFWTAVGSVERWAPGDASWSVEDEPVEPARSEGALATVSGLGALYAGGAANRDGEPLADVTAILTVGGVRNGPRMSHARVAPMAVALPDSSLLVVGGLGANGMPVAVAERLGGAGDPLRDLPPAPVALYQGAASGLPEGALFVGGVAADGSPSTAAFRYHSRYNRFASTGPLNAPRVGATVSAIGPAGEGWRLVVGGAPSSARAGLVELYDPVGDRFLVFELPEGLRRRRSLHTAASFTAEGGRGVLVFGGYEPRADVLDDLRDEANYVTEALRFELELLPDVPRPLPGDCLELVGEPRAAPCVRVRRGPPLSIARTALAAVAYRDGPVVVSGGLIPGVGQRLGTVESLVPGERAWSVRPSLNVARWGHWMLAEGPTPDSALVVIGGVGNVGEPLQGLSSVERLTSGDDRWLNSADAALGVPRMNGALIGVGGEVLLVGGQSTAPGQPLGAAELLTGAGPERLASLATARTRLAGCPVSSTIAMAYGGFTAVGATGSIELFEFTADGPPAQWASAGPAGSPLGDATCIGGLGRADIFGGRATPDGAATGLWQRFSVEADPPYVVVGEMARARLRPSVNAIGQQDAAFPAHLIVGGEDGRVGADDAVVVEVIYRDLGQRYAFALPPGVVARRDHAAVSHRFLAARAAEGAETFWRDVIVVGGQDAFTDEVLDEVLIFSIDLFGAIAPGG